MIINIQLGLLSPSITKKLSQQPADFFWECYIISQSYIFMILALKRLWIIRPCLLAVSQLSYMSDPVVWLAAFRLLPPHSN